MLPIKDLIGVLTAVLAELKAITQLLEMLLAEQRVAHSDRPARSR